MNQKQKEAIGFLRNVRTTCRIIGPNMQALTGAEHDAIREAIETLASFVSQATIPDSAAASSDKSSN